MTAPAAPGRIMSMIRHAGYPVCLVLPGAGGGLQPYARLAHLLGEAYEVVAARAVGLMPGEEPEDDVTVTADRVVADLLARCRTPQLIVGWSMGGVIGWEVAVRLADLGHQPDLIMIDSSPERRPLDPAVDAGILARLTAMLGPRPGPDSQRQLQRAFAAQMRALATHRVRTRYPGRVLLLQCAGDEGARLSVLTAWQDLAPALSTGRLDAGHFDVFEPEHFAALAGHLRAFVPALSTAEVARDR